MGRDCLSGPRCCTGIDCRDVTWAANNPVFEMEIAEGEQVNGNFPAAFISGLFRWPHSAKWVMADGQQLAPADGILSSGAEAWFHTIELDGDVDLEWSGGTIQLRGSAGTVTAGEHVAVIMPDDDTVVRTILTLYVTPSWYGVFVERFHRTQNQEWPNDDIIVTTRSSIQVIDRDNDLSEQSVTLAALGDVSVYQWRVADTSVQVEDDEIIDRCSRPILPMGTEANHRFQQAGTTSTPPEYTWDGTRTAPATLGIVGEVMISLENTYTCWDGTEDVEMHESYAGPFSASVGIGFDNPAWTDRWSSWGPTGTDGAAMWTMRKGGSVRTATYVCCPQPRCDHPPGGIGYASWLLGLASSVMWNAPTAENPYPKPSIRHGLSLQDPWRFQWWDVQTSQVTLGAIGEAPSTLMASLSSPPREDYHMSITSASIQWSAV